MPYGYHGDELDPQWGDDVGFAWPAPPMGSYGPPDMSDETDGWSDVAERYAGERIPPDWDADA